MEKNGPIRTLKADFKLVAKIKYNQINKTLFAQSKMVTTVTSQRVKNNYRKHTFI